MKDPAILVDTPEVSVDHLFQEVFEGYFEGYRRAMVLRASFELSLFEKTHNPVTAAHLAEVYGWDDVMTRLLLDCLVSMGLMEREAGMYHNSTSSATLLDPESPRYQGSNIRYMMNRLEGWKDLSTVVINGPNILPVGDVFGDLWIRAIGESAAGGGIAKVISEVESAIDLPEDGTLLDLGGGHGLYTVAFCSRHPGLKGYVFDKPEMTAVAEEFFREYGCTAETIQGDFYSDGLGGPYDVVFSSFNHSISDISLCEKVYSAVSPGGLLIMRRHTYNGEPDPIRLMEWNISIREGVEKGKQRFRGSWLPSSEEYVGIMESLGMETLYRKALDSNSELVIMRRSV